ncbi:MAG: SpoIIIAH-like family protein [Bacilli bacterium]|nr:SpoIIIAH-like family protein [Bacilli bacterium]MDD4282937.1 SpoIIIAH-like family protein [Bacilli bacterium]MDD4718671.1 SpoIIIAH-like family protein [Bacilli bacterium]
MINKKGIWFLTLFSLILVLSVYYITMPSELLLMNSAKEKDNEKDAGEVVVITESEVLTALRVEADEQHQQHMNDLKMILTSIDATVDEKNNAFEKLKLLNVTRGEEEKIEQQLQEEFKAKAFVKVEGNQIRVVIASDKHDNKLANDIMRSVQKNYENKMFISVKFQK